MENENENEIHSKFLLSATTRCSILVFTIPLSLFRFSALFGLYYKQKRECQKSFAKRATPARV